LPTNLPRNDKPKRSLFSTVLHAFMVTSAVLLGVAVLFQEERYIKGEPSYFAGMFDNPAQADDAPRTMAD
jgi:hypothetical protein